MRALVVAELLAEGRADGTAPERRLVRREQFVLAREQALECLGIAPPGHQSDPVTKGPSAGGRPRSIRITARCAPWRARDVRRRRPVALVREVVQRVEVGTHLALLEVVGEVERVLGALQSREGAAVLLVAAALRAGPRPGS